MFDGLKKQSLRIIVMTFGVVGLLVFLFANPLSMVKGVILIGMGLLWAVELGLRPVLSDGIQASDFTIINVFGFLLVLSLLIVGVLTLLGTYFNSSFIFYLVLFSLLFILLEAFIPDFEGVLNKK